MLISNWDNNFGFHDLLEINYRHEKSGIIQIGKIQSERRVSFIIVTEDKGGEMNKIRNSRLEF